MIIDELIKVALAKAENKKTLDVRVGLGYTCVHLEGGLCGLAYTFRNELGDCCGILNAAGSLNGKEVQEIIPWAKEKNLLKAAVGLAAINALLNDPQRNWDTGNVLNAFSLNETETFGMIGEFHPILVAIKNMTKKIYVFEKRVPEGSELYHADMIPRYLPECDVVVITATSIINHTIDDILLHCKNAREVCLVGPSVPLCPQVFKPYGITLLAGSVVKNPPLVLQIISQGGGTMTMKPAIDQVLQRI